MARLRSSVFTTIRTEGGLLPADLLARVAGQDRDLPGVRPADYHLVQGELLGERVTRSWNRLTGAWKAFANALSVLPADDAGTTLTRERWLLPLFEELGYGRLQTAKAEEIDGRSYAISHVWGHAPIHLVSARIPLDRRTPGVKGASGASPHSLVQEYLNRSSGHLWAFVSNGVSLRVLRDNASLTRQAYVEFDLETMFADEVFDDFVVLWLTCHQSRVEAENPAECWLERWTAAAAEAGTRAREELRAGVEAAIEALGAGFVAHPANTVLKERLRTGELNTFDYYRQLLRLIYRLLFLFVAEDRNLLHPPSAGDAQQRRYARYYSLTRVRTLANRRRGGPHPDLWRSLTVVFDGLGRTAGIPSLGLPGLGSFLWSRVATPDLDAAQIANQQLLVAVRQLAFVHDRGEKVLRPVDYRNLGTEELGAIYESLLEQHPDVNADAGTFRLNTAAGNERKTTGSYYTPTSLITELLDSAVDPVLAEAAAKTDAEAAILDLKVIDPACGSGHFLIAAAHRIAKKLAAVRTGDDEPSPDATRTALRDVIAHCVHGIDLNPMAVELCKVSLWMESMEPGKPLGFLDHRIVRGNGLIGATPQLLEAGVPDEAFKPLTGDDKAVVTSLKARNKKAREGQANLFGGVGGIDLAALATTVEQIDAAPDADLAAVQAKATRWNELITSPEYQGAVHAADTWCAAFVAEHTKGSVAITHEDYALARDQPSRVPADVRAAVQRLTDQYAFLHWHLAFPDVFAHRGGFDMVLGNPPWEQVQYDPKEAFSVSHPAISQSPTMAKRNKLIAQLAEEDPSAFLAHRKNQRHMEGFQHFVHSSGLYPFTSVGRLNTAPLFTERVMAAVAQRGTVGFIVPSGIATDSFNQQFFRYMVERHRLASLFDFENRDGLFPGVHSGMKFCLLTVTGVQRPVAEVEFVFFAHKAADLDDPQRRFTMSPDDLALLNPNTKTAPVFRTRRDAEITKNLYRRHQVLRRDNAHGHLEWDVSLKLMFMMNEASHLFRTRADLEGSGARQAGGRFISDDTIWLPLYEAKMAGALDHRSADVIVSTTAVLRQGQPSEIDSRSHEDPTRVAIPRYWISESEARAALPLWDRPYLIALRDLTSPTNERSTLISVLPESGVGHTMAVLLPRSDEVAGLISVFASFAMDYVVRQKLGGLHLSFNLLRQLPIPGPSIFRDQSGWSPKSVENWLRPYIAELVYTAWDLEEFAADIGYQGPPFRWNPARRESMRAELDAALFHLYGIERDDVDYIMDTFPIVRRKDEAAHGEYRTKRLILERYDALAEAAANGTEYQTILDPPPADPRCAHPESTRPDWARR